ncbi:hypothetical protein NF867_15790 [Solitalea sp. MAHUQ-68]|uniref:Uncharacterized protein n=1 Tax=Solitalea agri TaxID=2953739 RepID=A0A9X2JE37_9SPHI|nr:hypothetical protein [Solitalea agri]MCO4294324.1 hypothetical protein [Solitalea agri]
MKLQFAFILLIVSIRGLSHTPKDLGLEKFSAKWKADSLGLNGFRASNYSFQKKTATWLINGISFKGFTENQVIKILGKPTQSGHHKEDNGLIMTYIVRKKGIAPEIKLLIYFNKKDLVDDITESTGL